MTNKKLLSILEFNIILDKLSEYAVSEKSKFEIKNILPTNDMVEARVLQQLTHEAFLVTEKYLMNPIVQFDDAEDILNKARAGAVLQMGELLKISRLLRSARIAKKDITATGEDIEQLKKLISYVFIDTVLENSIVESIANESEMKDDASELLRNLRRKILATNNKLKDKLASYTRNSDVSKHLQDNIVTVRMGRFVLPVKSEARSFVPGLIHDQSASGSTVFIEPYPVVELNNELKFLQMEEAREVERILSVLSQGVANSYESLILCQQQCTMLDIVFAKYTYSVSFNGVMPALNNKGYINLINARHPLINRQKVVPVTVSVGDDYKLLIITGPNTGGKTVCLKTVGLCCLMAASGIWLPADDKSEISVFDNIFCDLGDEQSIAQSLSTFSAHIVNIINITDNITPKSLVLMDELGAGTDPIEGAALSIGIVKYLELMGAKGIITTHFSELKEYALVSPNLKNACMQFNEQTLSPTYKLIVGLPGVSNALKIAGTLGLNDYVLSKAREAISADKIEFEEILKNAEIAKFNAIKEAEEYAALKVSLIQEKITLENDRKILSEKLERINSNAKVETKRIVNKMLEQAEELMDELKEQLKLADEEALRKARQTRNRLTDLKHFNEEAPVPVFEELDLNTLKIGQKVVIKSLRSEGILNSLPDKKNVVFVSVGNLKTQIKATDLAKFVTIEQNQSKKSYHKPLAVQQKTTPTTTEVKVLGLTVAEAIEVIEPYLLSLYGSDTVFRIVHGKGTGALGKGIQNFLRGNAAVKSYRYGRYGEGDNGVTIVEIN